MTSSVSRSTPALSVRDVSVDIVGHVLLPPVTVELSPARSLAVIGPNGAGKTTFLRVLAGLQPPSHGKVSVLGAPPDERSPRFRRQVAALLGEPPLARDLTLSEYLTLVGTSWGHRHAEARRRSGELLEELGIAHLAARFGHELSTGQRQLYALSVVLARPADVLLLDEPESRLDAERLMTVADALERRTAAGLTLVLASHSPPLVDRLATERLDLGDHAGA